MSEVNKIINFWLFLFFFPCTPHQQRWNFKIDKISLLYLEMNYSSAPRVSSPLITLLPDVIGIFVGAQKAVEWIIGMNYWMEWIIEWNELFQWNKLFWNYSLEWIIPVHPEYLCHCLPCCPRLLEFLLAPRKPLNELLEWIIEWNELLNGMNYSSGINYSGIIHWNELFQCTQSIFATAYPAARGYWNFCWRPESRWRSSSCWPAWTRRWPGDCWTAAAWTPRWGHTLTAGAPARGATLQLRGH